MIDSPRVKGASSRCPGTKRAGETRRAARERVFNCAKMSGRPRGRTGGESHKPPSPGLMSGKSFTRRQALALGGAAVAGICLAGPAEGAAGDSRGRLKAYLRSTRGRRASRALKIRNANLRYKTKLAARHRLHRGDHSRGRTK